MIRPNNIQSWVIEKIQENIEQSAPDNEYTEKYQAFVKLVIAVEKLEDFTTFYFETKENKETFKKYCQDPNSKNNKHLFEENDNENTGYSISFKNGKETTYDYGVFPLDCINSFLRQLPTKTFLIASQGETILEKVQREIFKDLQSLLVIPTGQQNIRTYSDLSDFELLPTESGSMLFVFDNAEQARIFEKNVNHGTEDRLKPTQLPSDMTELASKSIEIPMNGSELSMQVYDILPKSKLMNPNTEKPPREIGVTSHRNYLKKDTALQKAQVFIKGKIKLGAQFNDVQEELKFYNTIKEALENGYKNNPVYKQLISQGKEFIDELLKQFNHITPVKTLDDDIKSPLLNEILYVLNTQSFYCKEGEYRFLFKKEQTGFMSDYKAKSFVNTLNLFAIQVIMNKEDRFSEDWKKAFCGYSVSSPKTFFVTDEPHGSYSVALTAAQLKVLGITRKDLPRSAIIVPNGASKKAEPFIKAVAKTKPANEIDFTIQLLLAYVDASPLTHWHSEKGKVEKILKEFLKEDQQTFETLTEIIKNKMESAANKAGTFYGLCEFITSDGFIEQWNTSQKMTAWANFDNTPLNAKPLLSNYSQGFFRNRHHESAVGSALSNLGNNPQQVKNTLFDEAKREDLNATGHFARLYYTLRFGG